MTYEADFPGPRRRARPTRPSRAIPYEAVASSTAALDQGLSGHVQRLGRKSQGISRWLALAVLAGAITALLVINFLAR